MPRTKIMKQNPAAATDNVSNSMIVPDFCFRPCANTSSVTVWGSWGFCLALSPKVGMISRIFGDVLVSKPILCVLSRFYVFFTVKMIPSHTLWSRVFYISLMRYRTFLCARPYQAILFVWVQRMTRLMNEVTQFIVFSILLTINLKIF